MYHHTSVAQYEDAVKQGVVFAAANQAAKSFTLFGNVTATGLVLTNPPASGKVLTILGISFLKVAAASAAIENLVISVGTATVTHTTPLTVQPCLVGGVVTMAVGLVDESATLGSAGVIISPFAAPSASATATTSIPPMEIWNVNGLFVVKPGSFIQLAAGFTNAVSGVGGIAWRESELP